jgi:hypothetical protein
MTPEEALKEIFNGMYNKQGFIKEFKAIEQALTELEVLKKDITRFLYLQTGRIPFTGEFTQSFIIENKPHPLAHESAVERNLKREYKELEEKLERLGDEDE